MSFFDTEEGKAMLEMEDPASDFLANELSEMVTYQLGDLVYFDTINKTIDLVQANSSRYELIKESNQYMPVGVILSHDYRGLAMLLPTLLMADGISFPIQYYESDNMLTRYAVDIHKRYVAEFIRQCPYSKYFKKHFNFYIPCNIDIDNLMINADYLTASFAKLYNEDKAKKIIAKLTSAPLYVINNKKLWIHQGFCKVIKDSSANYRPLVSGGNFLATIKFEDQFTQRINKLFRNR